MNNPRTDLSSQRCSVIALVGETNAGKSTLLNTLVGSKLAIVTPKVQTTRTLLRGIVMAGQTQLIFVDTPGIFTPKRGLEKSMVKTAWSGMDSGDTILLLIDSHRGITPHLNTILEGIENRVKRGGVRAIAVLNKTDSITPEKLLPLAAALGEKNIFEQVFMISGLTGDGVDDVKNYLAEGAPKQPWMFPEDQITDAPMRFIAAEITREKLFMKLRQELPYSLMVETEKWEERPISKTEPAGGVKVHQAIVVERESHKKIVLGKGGGTIRAVGEEARKDLERMLSQHVHLFLFVKVRENWQDDTSNLTL